MSKGVAREKAVYTCISDGQVSGSFSSPVFGANGYPAGQSRTITMPSSWWHEPAAGAVAGFVQDALMHPLDTMRARLDTMVSSPAARQASKSSSGLSSTSGGTSGRLPVRAVNLTAGQGPISAFFSTVRATLQAEGVRGLYGGYGVALLCSAPANAVYFGGYKVFQRALVGDDDEQQGDVAGPPSFRVAMTAGLGAEIFAGLLWTPLDVVKQRLQVAPVGTTTASVVREVVGGPGGARGLWKGYFGGIAVWGPFSATYFAVYETLKAKWGRGSQLDPAAPAEMGLDPGELAAGIVAGGCGAVVTQPLDCVKTRLQVGRQALSTVAVAAPVSGSSNASSSLASSASAAPPGGTVAVVGGREPGFLDIFRTVLREEGTPALMRGGAARAFWLAPGCGITIAVFEAVQRTRDTAS